jgi:cyanophycinase
MTQRNELGPLVLAGSGEYTPTMDLTDQYLLGLNGRRPVLVIATACAPEGDDVMTKWGTMGQAHFRKFGVEAVPVRIRDQDEANNGSFADQIAEAGFVWFSGGRATYLAEAFHETACWRALEEANRNGTIVAGSSGGLGVLNVNTVDPAIEGPQAPTGLGLAAPVRALPHFDRMEVRRPEFVERALGLMQPGQKLVGVDEDTAIVWHDGEWRVIGHKRAVVYENDGSRSIFHNGDRIDGLPIPERLSTIQH